MSIATRRRRRRRKILPQSERRAEAERGLRRLRLDYWPSGGCCAIPEGGAKIAGPKWEFDRSWEGEIDSPSAYLDGELWELRLIKQAGKQILLADVRQSTSNSRSSKDKTTPSSDHSDTSLNS